MDNLLRCPVCGRVFLPHRRDQKVCNKACRARVSNSLFYKMRAGTAINRAPAPAQAPAIERRKESRLALIKRIDEKIRLRSAFIEHQPGVVTDGVPEFSAAIAAAAREQ